MAAANLVSDAPGMAQRTEPNLVNPWTITLGTNRGLWVADNGVGKTTVYDGNGHPIPSGSPLIVTIPAPTGVATNATNRFVILSGSQSGFAATAPST